MSDSPDREELRWRILQQLPLLVALVILWVLLWGSVTWLNVISGIVVAILVTRFFYLPPVELSGRFNLFWLLVFLAEFLADLVVASFQVAWLAISPKPDVHSSVVAVQLRTRSDFITTATAIALSLVPGSIVIEVDRANAILYLHSLATPDLDAVERARAKALQIERKLVRALGSEDDLKRTTT